MEIGTLKELNVKPGDVVEWLGTFKRTKDFVAYKIGYAEGGVFRDSEDSVELSPCGPWRIIYRASEANHIKEDICKSCKGPYSYHHDCKCGKCERSPVRTVTKKEIVPGVYGKVSVLRSDGWWFAFTDNGDHVAHVKLTSAELRSAAETLIQIADALEA